MSELDDALLASVMRKVIEARDMYLDIEGSHLTLDGYLDALSGAEAEVVSRLAAEHQERLDREFSTFQAATAPAVRGLESGQVTIRELSEVLGHAQVSTTLNIYTHASEDSRTRAAAVIGRHLD